MTNSKLGIYFMNNEVRYLYETNAGVMTDLSLGYDCLAIQDYSLKKGEYALINLGIVVKSLSPLFFPVLVPKSSTFKKYGVIQTNSIGVIDNDFCGINDIVHMPVYALRDTKIKKGNRICQIILLPATYIETDCMFTPIDKSRGGFGSTGY